MFNIGMEAVFYTVAPLIGVATPFRQKIGYDNELIPYSAQGYAPLTVSPLERCIG